MLRSTGRTNERNPKVRTRNERLVNQINVNNLESVVVVVIKTKKKGGKIATMITIIINKKKMIITNLV